DSGRRMTASEFVWAVFAGTIGNSPPTGSKRELSARFWRRNAGSRDPLPNTRYNYYEGKPRRANGRKGCLSYGSNATTVRQRVSSQARKGVGNSLAGARGCSRRNDKKGAALRSAGQDLAG